MPLDFKEYDRRVKILVQREIPEAVRGRQQELALFLLAALIFGSPVGNPALWQTPAPPGYVGGQFRANWQVTKGTPATGTLGTTDEAGSRTLTNGQNAVSQVGLYATLWIVNNLAYAARLNDGWSTQAPPRWVDSNVAKAAAKFR